MTNSESHLSDRELIMAMDGELTPGESRRVEAHLQACWTCRSRKRELERAIADFVQLHAQELQLPPSDGPRALLRARIEAMAEPRRFPSWPATNLRGSALVASIACGLLIGFIATRFFTGQRTPSVVLAAPNPVLTPGAAILENVGDLCRESKPKNKAVSSALRRRVFEEYGLTDAPARGYEVDYLITPALGGADDIHNLWPHSYANTEWNAKVKDALEDRLRELVCEGKVNLQTAQRDISSNWIEAYKKYFQTDRPARSEP